MAATAAATLQPANEWESPFDHIDESSFSVDPAVTAAASGAVEEISRTMPFKRTRCLNRLLLLLLQLALHCKE
jgi:hypothetical protein